MIEYNLLDIKEYLKEHYYPLVGLILMADAGEHELLTKALGSERAAFDLLAEAKTYGALTKQYPVSDFPIAVNEATDEVTKKEYRLAGIYLSGQKKFLSVRCSLKAEELKFKLTKEEKEKVEAFYSDLFNDLPEIPDSAALDRTKALRTQDAGLKVSK